MTTNTQATALRDAIEIVHRRQRELTEEISERRAAETEQLRRGWYKLRSVRHYLAGRSAY